MKDLILIALVELNEVTAPTPNSYDEVLILFGFDLCGAELFGINCVELKLMSACKDVCANKLCDLFNCGFVFEYAVVKLECYGTAIASSLELVGREAQKYGERS